jgi:transcriptional regulator with XRE-family HTH domain
MSPIANLNEAGLQSLMELPTGSWGATDLLAAREGLGLTQAELAAAIGYDRSAIAKIEGGDTPPRRVVELAVRYLVNSRPQGTLFKINAPDSARFRPFETAIGLNEAHFPGGKSTDVQLAAGPAIWLRIFPKFDSGRRWSSIDLKKAATQGGFPLGQLLDGWSNLGFVRAADGFGVFGVMGEPGTTKSVSFAFETGEIWSVETYLIEAVKASIQPGATPGIPYLEDRFKVTINSFRNMLIKLGLSPPFQWIAGIEGIKGCGIFYPAPAGRYFPVPAPHGLALVDRVHAMGSLEDGDTPAAALKPFFKKVFDSFAVERPEYLDDLSNPR